MQLWMPKLPRTKKPNDPTRWEMTCLCHLFTLFLIHSQAAAFRLSPVTFLVRDLRGSSSLFWCMMQACQASWSILSNTAIMVRAPGSIPHIFFLSHTTILMYFALHRMCSLHLLLGILTTAESWGILSYRSFWVIFKAPTLSFKMAIKSRLIFKFCFWMPNDLARTFVLIMSSTMQGIFLQAAFFNTVLYAVTKWLAANSLVWVVFVPMIHSAQTGR